MTASNLLQVIVIAIAVTFGLWVTDLLGWREPDAADYVVAAIAGLVGGAIGVWFTSRRRAR